MERGFVDKNNFDADPDSQFNQETFRKMAKANPTLMELKQQQEKLIEDSSKAYEEWAVLKSHREQALNHLKLIPSPSPEMKDRMDGTGLRLTNHPLCILTSESLRDCLEVGQLLKSIDRTLLGEWYQWANGDPSLADSAINKNSAKGIAFNFATILWDSFEPRACDVHSTISSQVSPSFSNLSRS
jgi:TPR repeat protein